MDTRALYTQETALGGLCKVRYVSGQPQRPVFHQGHIKTYKNVSQNHLRDVQLCPSLQQLLHTLIGNVTTSALVEMTPEDELVPNCPACGTGRLKVRSMLYSVPFFNELAMFMVRCPKCGFSHNDVFSAEQRKPSRFTLHVDDETLLNIRVVRSGSCTYRLPEWGIDVEPGPSADAFITNVEGLLSRVRAVVETACRFAELKEEKDRASKILEEMKAAMQGQFPFTLVMEDPAGVSGIFPDDMTLVQYDELTSEEASKLKGAPVWVDTLREDISERKG